MLTKRTERLLAKPHHALGLGPRHRTQGTIVVKLVCKAAVIFANPAIIGAHRLWPGAWQHGSIFTPYCH
ncbi:uncharacterized protein TrAFT101_007413 [Trichoderma asperellum]|uniref:uncharacterized protein n=1 Tax=Trichoderma asperellum TaxID=101201 RepID=UPI00332888E3|nr:hypothetical protein TrAFT101_007413 [Trichoderma asperellum]